MEHLYKYRRSYGIELTEENGNGSSSAGIDGSVLTEKAQRHMLDLDEAAFFGNLRERDPQPGSLLWICRQIRWGSITFGRHLWSSGRNLWDDIRGGGLSLPGVIRSVRNWTPLENLKKTMTNYAPEIVWFKEALRPVVYGLRSAFQVVDVPTKGFAILLSATTVYLLWRSYFYMRHIPWREVDMKDKVVVITGGNSGIGERLVYEFIERGAHVVIVGYDLTKTLQVVENVHRYMATKMGTPEYEYDKLPDDGYAAKPEDFLYPLPHLQPEEPDYVKNLHWLQVDLGDSQTIWREVYHLFEYFDHVDMIINNGAIHLPDGVPQMSPDGLEAHFSVNYYGHFILTNLILSFMELPLQRSCKIINVLCTEAFCEGAVTMEQIYQAFTSQGVMDCPYARSKLCNYMFHHELTKRLEIAGLKDIVRTYAVSPIVCETNLRRHFPILTKWEAWIPGRSANAGAQTILHCALSQGCDGQTGLYYEKCHVSTPKLFGYRYLDKDFDEMCEMLWDMTEDATKTLINFYKTEDKPLQRGDIYGGAQFRDMNLIAEGEPDPEAEVENKEPQVDNGWIPQPVRERIEFRYFYTPVFMRPKIQKEWKDAVCKRGLIDLYTAINGPLRFAPRPNPSKIPSQDDFDPLYDRPPLLIKTKNSWIY